MFCSLSLIEIVRFLRGKGDAILEVKAGQAGWSLAANRGASQQSQTNSQGNLRKLFCG